MQAFRFIGILVLLSWSALVTGGQTQPAPVTITVNGDGSGAATGDMVTARFADNDIEFIGCGIRIFDDGAGGVFHWGFCQAEDSTGTPAFCSTMRPELLEAMHATSDYSFITFDWNAEGECQHVGFSTQSFYIPERVTAAPGRSGGR